jgi:predicted secreted Zn-dependent protease
MKRSVLEILAVSVAWRIVIDALACGEFSRIKTARRSLNLTYKLPAAAAPSPLDKARL